MSDIKVINKVELNSRKSATVVLPSAFVAARHFNTPVYLPILGRITRPLILNRRKAIAGGRVCKEYKGVNTRLCNDEMQISVPFTAPVGKVSFTARLQHTLHISDETMPQNNQKPQGVVGCEIWVNIGPECPADSNEFTYLVTVATTIYTYVVPPTDAKIVHYLLRWINIRGEYGPWGKPAMVLG
jgi:hypothetical protein